MFLNDSHQKILLARLSKSGTPIIAASIPTAPPVLLLPPLFDRPFPWIILNLGGLNTLMCFLE